MPIPFRTAAAEDELDALGEAGFLKIDYCAVGPSYLGALLLVNARGEPVEFTYSRVETPFAVLWRPDDVRRFAARTLAVSLLSLCPRVPRLLLCLAEEVERELFEQDVQLSVPTCRVARAVGATPVTNRAALAPPAPTADLFWLSGTPPAESEPARLLHELTRRGFDIEPFDRASRGLREVYGSPAGGDAT